MTASQTVLAAHDVCFSYRDTPVLEHVSLSLAAGEFVALAGPNGAGKSTLLRILLGLAAPQSGRVEIFGSAPAQLSERWRVAYVPQRLTLHLDLPATVEEVVRSGRLPRRGWWRPLKAADQAAVDHAIEAVQLGDLRTRPVTELSGGQQQRVLIAKAFAAEPQLLVLDEPIAGVDAESQELFRDSLAHLVEHDRTAVLLVSHELGAVADDLDRVVVLRRRVVFDGPPKDLAATGVSLGVHRDDLPMWLEALPVFPQETP